MVVRANPEKKEEKERIRHALFRATLSLASAHGFASLGLREVSREALIAPTSFYRHFEDMEQLGVALIEERVRPLLREVSDTARARAAGDGRPFAAAGHAVWALFDAAAEDAALVRFLVAERVGGLERFRRALDDELTRFGEALFGDAEARGAAGRVLLVVLVDAAFRAVEAADGERAPHVAAALAQVTIVVHGASASRGSP